MRALLLAALLAVPAHAAKKKNPLDPKYRGSQQAFDVSERDLRLAVDKVFSQFAALGWAVREENDAVHASRVHKGDKTQIHAYLRPQEGKSAVEVVYESKRDSPKQRAVFEWDIIQNVSKQLKASSPKAP